MAVYIDPWYVTGIVYSLRRCCFHEILSSRHGFGSVFDKLTKEAQTFPVDPVDLVMDFLVVDWHGQAPDHIQCLR